MRAVTVAAYGTATSPPRSFRRYIARDAVALVTAALAVSAGAAFADEKLARERHCLACHRIDGKLVGPSYRDVAARYRGDAAAEVRLAVKIRAGGAGAWGTLAMAPNPAVTEADARLLARWVLSLK
jgi:cytochrome c